MDHFASKLKAPVAHQRPREQTGFTKNLEPVANTQDRPALGCKFRHRLHNRAESCDGSTAEIIAVTKATGDNHSIGSSKALVLMPMQTGRMPQHLHGMDTVLVAVGRGKLEDSKLHGMKRGVNR